MLQEMFIKFFDIYNIVNNIGFILNKIRRKQKKIKNKVEKI